MKLSIEATSLATMPYSGIDRCLLEGIHALCAQDAVSGIRLLVKASRRRGRRLLPAHPKLTVSQWKPRLRPLGGHDVHFAPAYLAVPRSGRTTVSWLHDFYAHHGLNHPDPDRRQRQIKRVRDLVAASDHVVCISQATLDDLRRFEPTLAVPASVVHHGVSDFFRPVPPTDVESTRQATGLAAPYLLFSGLMHENKNMSRLLAAFARSDARQQGACLALTGPNQSDGNTQLRQACDALGITQQVICLGYVDDSTLRALYCGAEAYLFPSLAEGFGLPILEAMACGTPVLTSTHPACVETANGHAVLVDPLSVDAIADGIDQTMKRSDSARQQAQQYAQSKTWARSAEALVQVFRTTHRS